MEHNDNLYTTPRRRWRRFVSLTGKERARARRRNSVSAAALSTRARDIVCRSRCRRFFHETTTAPCDAMVGGGGVVGRRDHRAAGNRERRRRSQWQQKPPPPSSPGSEPRAAILPPTAPPSHPKRTHTPLTHHRSKPPGRAAVAAPSSGEQSSVGHGVPVSDVCLSVFVRACVSLLCVRACLCVSGLVVCACYDLRQPIVSPGGAQCVPSLCVVRKHTAQPERQSER